MNDPWVVAPVLIPLFAAALQLLLGDSERARRQRALLSAVSAVLTLAVALRLNVAVAEPGTSAGGFALHAPGNWPVPFGIVLLVDRLAALMLLLVSVVVLAATVQSLARWHRAGVHFHPLLQLQLMGLNGVFLTSDLFNLFVFIEILLAASYGLLLHGTGAARVRAGLHYVAVNLVASSLLLVAITILYGITGSLGMADVAARLVHTAPADRGLLQAGAAVFGVALLVKAGCWPLNFWLAPAYGAASAPVAGIFAVMTKVGVYALLRLWLLLFPVDAGMAERFGADVITWAGLATLAVGALGMLSGYRLARLAASAVIVSSGTLLAVVGIGGAALLGAALYYLVASTIASCAVFLLVELIERLRGRDDAARVGLDDVVGARSYFSVQMGRHGEPPAGARAAAGEAAAGGPVAAGDAAAEGRPIAAGGGATTNLDDSEAELFGRPIGRPLMLLGFAFLVCTLTLAGLPPMAGFTAKVLMVTDLLGRSGPAVQVLIVLLLASGLCTMIGLSRAGIRAFWARSQTEVPRMTIPEYVPVAVLCAVLIALSIGSAAALSVTQQAARSLADPQSYLDAVQRLAPREPRR